MTINLFPTDSAITIDGTDAPPPYPYVQYTLFSQRYLQALLAHLVDVSSSEPAAALPSLTEITLYALTAAIALNTPSDLAYPNDGLIDALLAELRWRNCRAMGTDPTGSVRRGRLIQMVSTFTTLKTAGASPLQRNKLAAVCPFCRATEFCVLLPSVRWRCFECGRHGALLEFAVCLLESRVSPPLSVRLNVSGPLSPGSFTD